MRAKSNPPRYLIATLYLDILCHAKRPERRLASVRQKTLSPLLFATEFHSTEGLQRLVVKPYMF
jgi:hypothetical protein